MAADVEQAAAAGSLNSPRPAPKGAGEGLGEGESVMFCVRSRIVRRTAAVYQDGPETKDFTCMR